MEEAEEYIKWLNSAPDRIKGRTRKIVPYIDGKYIIDDNGQLKVDRNMVKYDIVN